MPPIEPLLERLNPEARQSIESRNLGTTARFTMFSGQEIAAWPGIDATARGLIDDAMAEAGYPRKLWPL